VRKKKKRREEDGNSPQSTGGEGSKPKRGKGRATRAFLISPRERKKKGKKKVFIACSCVRRSAQKGKNKGEPSWWQPWRRRPKKKKGGGKKKNHSSLSFK